MNFKRKILMSILITVIVSTGFFMYVKMVLDPDKMKHTQPEKIEDALARIYENFLHKTKYSYEKILESGTNYNNQERVFVELTKKMKTIEQSTPDFVKNADYKALQDLLEKEIAKNRSAFETFFAKATGTSPEELKKLVKIRNEQYDIVLEGE